MQTRCGDKYPPDLAGMRHQIDRAASDLLRCVELARVWLQKQKKAELKRKKSERAMQKREEQKAAALRAQGGGGGGGGAGGGGGGADSGAAPSIAEPPPGLSDMERQKCKSSTLRPSLLDRCDRRHRAEILLLHTATIPYGVGL